MFEIKNLSVSYGDNKVYEDFSLSLEDGKVTCILGESGCGKTTLLNAVASLIRYDGYITPTSASYVFQSPRLIPNLTVLKNLTIVGADPEKAADMLGQVGLAGKEDDYPERLSGGERQRVALCRAFLYPSDILLLDEPFSSLDLKTKLSVMQTFKELEERDGRTVLAVTHDIDEALYLADRIVVIKNGTVAADFQNARGDTFGAGSPLREELINALLK